MGIALNIPIMAYLSNSKIMNCYYLDAQYALIIFFVSEKMFFVITLVLLMITNEYFTTK